MRVVLSTIRRFHTFDLARELHRRSWLDAVFTGYPRAKLKQEDLPARLIRCFPWLPGLYLGRLKLQWIGQTRQQDLIWWSLQALDQYTAMKLPSCDIYMALSGVGLNSGRRAQERGAIYICDRGSTHIRFQDRILREEYRLQGVPYRGIDARIIAKEEAEYERADAITVPSGFALDSFREITGADVKIHRISYGVDLTRFCPVGTPDHDRLDVLFVGAVCLRKGLSYLLEAFSRVRHPRKQLTLVGAVLPEMDHILARYAQDETIQCLGHIPQHELKLIMSRSHVLVLPSIEDGFGMVMAQAMACGCPVIATINTGAPDLYQDGKEGFIVNIRDPQAIADCLQQLADDRALHCRMSVASLERVQAQGGWEEYGRRIAELFLKLT